MARKKRDAQRRRKSRSDKGGKGKKIMLYLGLSAAALFLIAIVSFYQTLRWLQGEGFCRALEEYSCNKAQAERVEIPEPLTIQGSRLSLPSFSMERKGLLNRLHAKRISTEIERSELLHRHLLLNKLIVEDLSLQMDPTRIGEKLPKVQENEGGFSKRITPKSFDLNAFECKDTDITLRVGEKPYALAGFSLFAQPQPKLGKDAWQLNLENGRLRTPLYFLQDCSLKNASLLVDAESYNLSECRIQLTPGELRVKGAYEQKSQLWSTTLRANKANVARLLTGDWKKRLSGELYGELELTGKGGSLAKGSGIVALQQGLLEGLPILSDLQLHGTTPYRSIRLDKAECRIYYPFDAPAHNISDAWLFDCIDIRAAGDKLLVRGHVIIGSDHSLGGTLKIGLPESVFRSLGPESGEILAQLFTGQGESGFVWVNLNLSGTIDDPQEDLSVRMSTIISQALPDLAANAVKAAPSVLLNLLPGNRNQKKADTPSEQADNPDDEAPAPATDNRGLLDHATDKAGDIIGSGLNILF